MRFPLFLFVSTAALSLAGCNFAPQSETQDKAVATAPTATPSADPFASHDEIKSVETEDKPRPIMQAQVSLDRLGFAPGVIDDKMGQSTVNAIKGFQEANNLPQTGALDDATKAAILRQRDLPATRMVTIPEDFATRNYIKIPAKAEDKAKLAALDYETLIEALAERFHTTPDVLRALNPSATPQPVPATSASAEASTTTSPADTTFAAGKTVRVPNIGGDAINADARIDPEWRTTLVRLGVGTSAVTASRIIVDESDGILKVLDGSGKLLAQFTATMGSEHDPLPIGTWKINGVAYNPPFTYNPKLFWDVADSKPKLQFEPGPNSPVGVVWIDLSKDHYGIHGTPSPETIGRAESHGCVRLTNWDAARLAMMVKPGVEVVFQK